jgi:FADH2 O2-dependent halogenase
VTDRYEVAIVGSGFAGSLLARILTVLGYDVVLLERGTHPRFAIGESSTPLANLSLERIARRYGLADCRNLAAHGRWLEHLPDVQRGLKRGFTFYRHRPGQELHDSERLMVAASPTDYVADSHWLRADVDHHFVRQAAAAGLTAGSSLVRKMDRRSRSTPDSSWMRRGRAVFWRSSSRFHPDWTAPRHAPRSCSAISRASS